MKKRWKKILLIAVIVLFTGLLGMILFSPYGRHEGQPYKSVSESVEINAPVEDVFAYMGNSAHATDWSVYVDHITTLNPEEHPDGTVGCKRRCFTSAEETGPTWDETIMTVEKNKRRRLNIYNQQHFSLTADHLLTEQLYEKISGNQCRLTLTLFFDEGKESFAERLKMYFAAYKVARIFRGNLANIKKFNEQHATKK